jgi:acyl dehydratase
MKPLERTITLADMVAYAGATWDWHRLHYDPSYAERPVVDGQMLGALMAKQVMDHFGPRVFITHLEFRLRSPVYAGDAIRCEGEANPDGTATLRVLVGERVAAEGSVRVRL